MQKEQFKFKIGVFGIIFDEKNRILLYHRNDYDLWNLPGGRLEGDETPLEGVIREIKEETGLVADFERLSGIYSKPDQGEILFQFVCKIIDGEITLNDEADRIEYFDFADLPKNTSPKQVERILYALNNTQLEIKTQTGISSIQLIKKGLL